MGRVHYPNKNRYGCLEFKTSDFDNDFLYDEESDLSPVVVVDRGECTFVTKVRNIEKLGVKMAIVVDNKVENTEDLIMADDGSGHSVHIPSFIIRKQDGDHIKAAVKKNEVGKKDLPSVYIKGELLIERPDNRVEYELWYSSILDLDYGRLNDLGLYQEALNKEALFTPRIFTYSCTSCSEEVKLKNCVSNGEYCAYLPK
jgi:hypothetical protein